MTPEMREVTKDEFFVGIGNRDVHPEIVGNFPYTAIFRTKARVEVGRIVEFLPWVAGEPQKKYLLPRGMT